MVFRGVDLLTGNPMGLSGLNDSDGGNHMLRGIGFGLNGQQFYGINGNNASEILIIIKEFQF